MLELCTPDQSNLADSRPSCTIELSWLEPLSTDSVSAAASPTDMDSSSLEGSAQLAKCGLLPSGSGAVLSDASPLMVVDEDGGLLCEGEGADEATYLPGDSHGVDMYCHCCNFC